MIYVINRSEDKNILISSFLPLPIGNEEDDPSPIPLYVFDWNYNDLAPSIRYFVVDPSVENCNIYFPEVLDFLDTIKDQQNPPQYNLPKRIYDAKTRIDAFNSSLQTLINIGILDKVEVKPVKDNIIYDIDLTSQLERNYSADIVDIVNSWRYLARSEKLAIEEIYKTTNYGYSLKLENSIIIRDRLPYDFKPVSYINAKYRGYNYNQIIEKFCKTEDDINYLQLDLRTKLSLLLIMNPGKSLNFKTK